MEFTTNERAVKQVTIDLLSIMLKNGTIVSFNRA